MSMADTANMVAEEEPAPPAPFHAPPPAQQQQPAAAGITLSMLNAALNNPNAAAATAAAPTAPAPKRPTFVRPPAIHWYVHLVGAVWCGARLETDSHTSDRDSLSLSPKQ
jgi:hypothetical protein